MLQQLSTSLEQSSSKLRQAEEEISSLKATLAEQEEEKMKWKATMEISMSDERKQHEEEVRLLKESLEKAMETVKELKDQHSLDMHNRVMSGQGTGQEYHNVLQGTMSDVNDGYEMRRVEYGFSNSTIDYTKQSLQESTSGTSDHMMNASVSISSSFPPTTFMEISPLSSTASMLTPTSSMNATTTNGNGVHGSGSGGNDNTITNANSTTSSQMDEGRAIVNFVKRFASSSLSAIDDPIPLIKRVLVAINDQQTFYHNLKEILGSHIEGARQDDQNIQGVWKFCISKLEKLKDICYDLVRDE